MSIAGGCDRAVRAAQAIGFDTVQLFTKNNNQWHGKPLSAEDVATFRRVLRETRLRHATAHDCYLINLASPDADLYRRSVEAFVVELQRVEALGLAYLVTHPGAHVDSGEEAGLERVARALDEALARCPGFRVKVLLETTAGQGTCLGRTFEHLASILDRVRAPERLGVCVDTCHIFAAGYPLAGARDYNETFDALDRAVGPGRVRVWHLNDSLRERGSRVDRHAGLGRGRMGLEPFWRLVRDPRTAGLPLILETPQGIEDGAELDAVNLGVLRRLAARKRPPISAAPSGGDARDTGPFR